jgi:hypothetical protein
VNSLPFPSFLLSSSSLASSSLLDLFFSINPTGGELFDGTPRRTFPRALELGCSNLDPTNYWIESSS